MRSSSVLLLWLPLVAASKTKATDPVEGAAAIDRWFQSRTNKNEDLMDYAPKAWTVTRPDDVPRPWREIGTSSKYKSVHRATVNGKPVIAPRGVVGRVAAHVRHH